jgi:hypothetical protein
MSCKSSGTYSIHVHVGDDGEIIPVPSDASPPYNSSDSHPSAGLTDCGLSPQNPVAEAVSHIMGIIQGQDSPLSLSDSTQLSHKSPLSRRGEYYYNHPGEGWYQYQEGHHTMKGTWQAGEYHDEVVGCYLHPN